MMKLDAQIVGNVGIYLTCFCRSLLGWNAMPTARNSRGIDIVAYKRNGSGYLGVQVKTLRKRSPAPRGTSLDKIMTEFWIIVSDALAAPHSLRPAPGRCAVAGAPRRKGRPSVLLAPTICLTRPATLPT